MITRTSRRALACALFATTSLMALAATPAQAQVKRPAADEHGVDVISGGLMIPSGRLTIGQPAEGGLEFYRIWNKGGWYHNLKGAISTNGATRTVTIGSSVESFTLSAGIYQSNDGLGSTLTFANPFYTYTTADGTVMKFETPGTGKPALLNSITKPNGLVTTFWNKYQAFCELVGGTCDTPVEYHPRLQGVTTNTGYHMHFDYAQNFTTTTAKELALVETWQRMTKVTAINGTTDYCDPNANSCSSLTQPWPFATIARNSGGAFDWTDVWADALANATTATVASSALTAIKSPADPANDFSLTYDASGRVATFARGGGTWTYGYVDAGAQRTTTVTQPLGGSKIYVSEPASRKLLSMTDELGRTTSYQFDTSVRPTRVTRPEGDYSEVTYDARGNVTQSRAVAKAGSGLADIVTSSVFAASCTNAKTCNKPTSSTDERGFVTDYTYDTTHGGVLTATAPAPSTGAVRPQVRYAYSALSAYYKNSAGTIVTAPTPVTKLTAASACQTLASCTGGADEVKSTIAYGATGVANNLLPTGITNGNGNGTLVATTTRAYDIFGNLTSINGPLSGTADTAGFRYDADRRLTMRVSPDPDGAGVLKHRAERLTYNGDGNVTKIESGTTTTLTGAFTPIASGERVELAYDVLGRKVKQSLVSGTTTPVNHAVSQYSYDSKGRPLCTTQRMNPVVFASLPADACTLGTAGSAGSDRIGKAIYDTADQVTEVRIAVGTADEAAEPTLTYTLNGQLATLTDAEVNKTTYEYDGHDRLAKTRFPLPTKGSNASSTTDFEQLTYDAASNVTARRLRDTTSIAFTYDNLDRPTLKNLPGTEPDVTYAYDNLSRLTSASQTGNALSFTYDALSRNLTQVGPQGTLTSAWDLAGRRTQLTYPGTGLFVNYDYLVTDEMTKIRENGATTGIGVLATFAYDDLGRRTSLTFGNTAVATYAYDPVSRLASLTQNLAGTANDLTITINGYNPASQIASQTRSNDLYAWTGHGSGSTPSVPNGLNQLASIGGAATAHDARGNLTSDPTTGKAYGYSPENLLKTATGGVTLAYDPLLRLYDVTGAATTRFAYDGLDMIAEYSAANALQRRFVHGPAIDEPLVEYEGAGTTDRRFLHADERGSIVATSDAAGAMLAINKYDEYGKPQAGNAGRFQYTGQMWLGELGLYHYKARAYAPHLGRFLQTDPIEYEDSANLYAYVGNDPVNFTDPLGLQACGGELEPSQECVSQDGTIVVTAPATIVVTGQRPTPAPMAIARAGTVSSGGVTGGSGSGGGGSVKDIVVTCSKACQARHKAKTIIVSLIPGVDLLGCFAGGCSGFHWGLAGFDLIPGWGKLGKLAKLCGCLEAGTLVATPGGLVPIESIAVGDLVLAVDEATGKVAPKPVTALIRPEPKPLYRLALLDAGGEAESFHATDDHPWKVEGNGWIKTLDLNVGDRIKTGLGADMEVTALRLTSRVERTYNLTVADFHTFMIGEDRAVVHNVDCKVRIPGKSGKEAAKNAPSWVRGQAPHVGESGRDFARRLMDAKYGRGNYSTRPGSEFSQIKKYADRGFK